MTKKILSSEDGSLGDKLNLSVPSKELKDLTTDYAEIGLDRFVESIYENEAVKAIPILKSILGITQGIKSVRDYHYIKRIALFLFKVGQVSESTQASYRQKLVDSPEEANRAANAVIEILDKLTYSEKAPMIAKVFIAYMNGEITTSGLILLCEIIDRTYLEDLHNLEKDHWRKDTPRLVHVGIMKDPDIDKYMGRNQEFAAIGAPVADYAAQRQYTSIGRKLVEILRNP